MIIRIYYFVWLTNFFFWLIFFFYIPKKFFQITDFDYNGIVQNLKLFSYIDNLAQTKLK